MSDTFEGFIRKDWESKIKNTPISTLFEKDKAFSKCYLPKLLLFPEFVFDKLKIDGEKVFIKESLDTDSLTNPELLKEVETNVLMFIILRKLLQTNFYNTNKHNARADLGYILPLESARNIILKYDYDEDVTIEDIQETLNLFIISKSLQVELKANEDILSYLQTQYNDNNEIQNFDEVFHKLEIDDSEDDLGVHYCLEGTLISSSSNGEWYLFID